MMLIKEFKNFVEPWDYAAISTELCDSEVNLLNKYKNIYFQDDDPLYTGRVVLVDWKNIFPN
jgi:hypothetical protein